MGNDDGAKLKYIYYTILYVIYSLITKNIMNIKLLSSFIAKKQFNIEESKTGADAWR